VNRHARVRPTSVGRYSRPHIYGERGEEKKASPRWTSGLRLGQEDTDLLTHIGRFVKS